MQDRLHGRKEHFVSLRFSAEELLVLEARAELMGLTRSELIRHSIERSWSRRTTHLVRPLVTLTGLMLIVIRKLAFMLERKDIPAFQYGVLHTDLDHLHGLLREALDSLSARHKRTLEKELDAIGAEKIFE